MRAAGLACVAALLPAAVALAAHPKHGGTYIGRSSTGKSVVIKVSRSGKRGRFVYCQDKQGVRFKIKPSGRFTATLKLQGPGTVFKATGRFTTRRKVSGRIRKVLTCDGKPAKYSAKLR